MKTGSAFTFALFTLLLGGITSDGSACEKKMRWNDDPPYSYTQQDTPDKIVGISVDIAKLILSQLDCQLIFVKMPWARALKEIEAGRIDFVDGAYVRPEREVYVHFSSVGFHSPNILFERRKEAERRSLTSLAEIMDGDYRLGVQIGVSYGGEFDQLSTNEGFQSRLIRVSQRESL